MVNDSSTGGYLQPAVTPAPLEDQAFEDFLQEIFVGLSGLPTDSVIPRWQPEPINQPDLLSDWIAFGIMRQDPDVYAVVEHDPTGNGQDQMQRHETVEILLSSYGPNSVRNLSTLRDGLQVSQNRDVLTTNGMGVVQTGEMTPVPTLVKDRWLRRYDMMLTIRRQILRSYPVLNLSSAQATLNTDDGITTPIAVTGP